MWRFYFLFAGVLISLIAKAQTPGFYFGPRVGLGQAQFTGQSGFSDGLALQVGVQSTKQFNEHIAVQFTPYIGLYNGQRNNGEFDGVHPNGTRRVLQYQDKYNIFSVEFPLYAKFTSGFRNMHIGVFGGPSLGYIMAGTRSKQYQDPVYNSKHGYGGHAMDDLKRGMYSGDLGVSVELQAVRGILSIDFKYHHNFTPLGRLEGVYFSANTKTVGLTWMFNAL
jgi:hypothetical protein